MKHKMSINFFGWFVQYPNVGHKIACSMKKWWWHKIKKLKRKIIILINYIYIYKEKENMNLKGEKVKEIRKLKFSKIKKSFKKIKIQK